MFRTTELVRLDLSVAVHRQGRVGWAIVSRKGLASRLAPPRRLAARATAPLEGDGPGLGEIPATVPSQVGEVLRGVLAHLTVD